MINNKRIVAFIPVRGGSKSIINKNLALLGGKPLVAWPIEVALEVPEIDEIIVSTDDQNIANTARSYNVTIQHRPDYLATDTALVADAVRYCRTVLSSENNLPDYMILLEATSPFRTKEIIQKCLYRLVHEELDSIATFNESEINPHRIWSVENGQPEPFIKGAIPWISRQNLPKAYQLNGVVYAFSLKTFPNEGPNVLFGKMGAEILDENSVIDIDTKKDLVIANVLFETRNSTEII
ncbi:acylneuraminate cytidylyltransferase family protein [Legionella pneumophila subsp. fraseri]|nr:acylneuraminate cytidylyltransferase family protein [Legionella pneumophila]MDW8879086.1 acylneuraminate cytidylyltransferase family protein [Legionella pneumophila subsp. fraseri]MDW8961564.1 acylneuraminate cytidylyltransferase family protein [Legionella pneumophila subsp. fraseri]HAT1798001.1 acylneuraminate cytidylyltransferase family protein [Legionella pneumophila]HAT1846180.1 acylneuraminate cytidylyltransferase family protein [Legionella pneumophila]HAT1862593.1 acylneuraminate cyti